MFPLLPNDSSLLYFYVVPRPVQAGAPPFGQVLGKFGMRGLLDGHYRVYRCVFKGVVTSMLATFGGQVRASANFFVSDCISNVYGPLAFNHATEFPTGENN